ncbi:amino acid ABC transporter ATP-binding protein, PAAT family [Bifidobacterium bohemicum]|uniref:Amino acid ABC transporter ATP-binding protein n=2 Tax=Bifidobacterium bohemicum TaxID=638617 RepID=A0A086ZEF6_9BIFI|nr:amino acid ABC transporter ATP-binding protein [Bifidobacterium bohemicum DSM 22767]SCB96984.1 amino acid ABC transporter ATP-binding protein, PAAT family [Bifidobacterium bohemicum]
MSETTRPMQTKKTTDGGTVTASPNMTSTTKTADMTATTLATTLAEPKQPPCDQDDAKTVLQVRNICKSYGANHVLHGVSFDIRAHQVVALLGPSGSGKSTLMKCINLLERVDDGQIMLNGTDITDPRVDADESRARIGVVFQQFNLFPHMTVLRNVTLGAIKVHHWNRHDAEAKAHVLLKRIGMDGKADSYPDQLSGGQQQRVAIARALMADPELLLLDEITSALDPMLVGEVLELVTELKTQGTTILMATHEMEFAHHAADRVLLLRNGSIAEDGTPCEVMDESQDPATQDFFAHFRQR